MSVEDFAAISAILLPNLASLRAGNCPVTRSAFPRRGLVEQHGLTVDLADRLVAEGAGHFLVRPLEGERGARFVVKQRGLPFRRVVAGNAIRQLPRRRELPPANFLMAGFTLAGRRTGI